MEEKKYGIPFWAKIVASSGAILFFGGFAVGGWAWYMSVAARYRWNEIMAPYWVRSGYTYDEYMRDLDNAWITLWIAVAMILSAIAIFILLWKWWANSRTSVDEEAVAS
jgi:hypothetical protein